MMDSIELEREVGERAGGREGGRNKQRERKRDDGGETVCVCLRVCAALRAASALHCVMLASRLAGWRCARPILLAR